MFYNLAACSGFIGYTIPYSQNSSPCESEKNILTHILISAETNVL
jgi:hypothetical protein